MSYFMKLFFPFKDFPTTDTLPDPFSDLVLPAALPSVHDPEPLKHNFPNPTPDIPLTDLAPDTPPLATQPDHTSLNPAPTLHRITRTHTVPSYLQEYLCNYPKPSSVYQTYILQVSAIPEPLYYH